MLHSEGGELLIRHNYPAHHGNPGGNCGQIRFEPGQLLAAIHRLHKERLKLLAGTFGFRQSEESLLRFRRVVPVLVVVFVRQRNSVLAVGLLDGRVLRSAYYTGLAQA